MRWMGDMTLENAFFQAGAGPLDPTVKAGLLPYAKQMDDGRARDLLELVDATPLGTRTKFLRIGLGAVGGLALGLLLSRAARR